MSQEVVNAALGSFNNATGVFNMPPDCSGSPPGWWNTANGLTAIALKDLRRGDRRNLPLLSAALGRHVADASDLRPAANLFNDDQLWWLWLACEMAHLDGADARWLDAAERGWAEVAQCVAPTACGNVAVSWQRRAGPVGGCIAPLPEGYVASIANSLLLVVSAKLFELTRMPHYLQMAELLWRWMLETVVDSQTKLVHDGIEAFNNCTLRTTYWSYNQGVLIAGLAALYTATQNSSFLDAAVQLADAGMAYFASSEGVVRETACEDSASCGCDGVEFRGPFVRGLSYLFQSSRDHRIATFLNNTLTSALQNDCNSRWQFQLHWGGPYNLEATSATQMPVLDLFAAVYAVSFDSPGGVRRR